MTTDDLMARLIGKASPDGNDLWSAAVEHITKLRAERDEAIEALDTLHMAVSALIRDSHGVAGLHRNGDVAPWDELLPGGRFEEWLEAMGQAAAILAKHAGRAE